MYRVFGLIGNFGVKSDHSVTLHTVLAYQNDRFEPKKPVDPKMGCPFARASL